MNNEDIHYDEIQKFLDSNPKVSGDFNLLKFSPGFGSTSSITYISLRPGGEISFDDVTSEFKDRSNYNGRLTLSWIRSRMDSDKSYDRMRMVAVGSEEEHFQRSILEDNLLPLRFNTLYNMLLNIAWAEMYKFRL